MTNDPLQPEIINDSQWREVFEHLADISEKGGEWEAQKADKAIHVLHHLQFQSRLARKRLQEMEEAS